MSQLNLDTVDADGAIREAEDAVAGDTRATFFRKAAIGGGAVLSSGAIMGMLPELAAAKPSKKHDLAILNFALTLEYLEAEFYARAAQSGALSGDPLEFAKLVASHEKTHVSVLRQTINKLGGKPVKKPTFDFMGTTDDQGKFIATAYVLENTGVNAYLGQAGNLKSKALLAAAASIVTVEARHASAIAVIQNANPYVDDRDGGITPAGAFDRAYSKSKILKIVGSTGFIQG
jgi:rubrerythrin